MVLKLKRPLITYSLVALLMLTSIFIIPVNVSASTSYVNSTLFTYYKEFGLGINFDSWNHTSLYIRTSDSLNLNTYTATDLLIQNIVIFNDSNNNGFFDESEENLTIHDQLNNTNFSPNPPDLVIVGSGSVQGKLINITAWSGSTTPNATFSIHAIAFNSPTEYQNVLFNYLEAQLKIQMNISNWPSWGPNVKLLMIYNISSKLNLYKNSNQLQSTWFDENPGPDVDDDEHKVLFQWDFFQNATINSSINQACNQTIAAIGSNWILNFTFNKFDNLSYNGSKILISLGTVTNNFLFFVLFAIMLVCIIITIVIIYYTRERRNKLLDDLSE